MIIIFLTVWNLAINMSGPFFLVYMFKRIGISLFMVTVLIVVNQLSNILFLNIWGRISDRFSNKSVLKVSGPLFLISILLWTFTTNPDTHGFTIPLLFIIHVLNGIAVSGVTIATTNITLKLSPKGKAHSYMTAVGLSTSVIGSIAPILGGFLADFFDTIQIDLPLLLKANETVFTLPIISLKGLDFLFLLTFIIGLHAIHRLAFITERGEVERKKVIDELTLAITMPIKSLSLMVGASQIAVMPISALMHIAQKVTGKNTKAKTTRKEHKSKE
jgi:MFS family permease